MADIEVETAVSDVATQDVGGKFLTFFLGREEYGIEILKVREIIGMMDITAVPRTPKAVLGVINLRGKVIPVIDLRLKFGMAPIEPTEHTCIIVVEANGLEMGTVVDRVSEVSNISGDQIDMTPSFGEDVSTDYILGIGKVEGRVKLLLEIDRALSTKGVLPLNMPSEDIESAVA